MVKSHEIRIIFIRKPKPSGMWVSLCDTTLICSNYSIYSILGNQELGWLSETIQIKVTVTIAYRQERKNMNV